MTADLRSPAGQKPAGRTDCESTLFSLPKLPNGVKKRGSSSQDVHLSQSFPADLGREFISIPWIQDGLAHVW